MSLIPSAFEAGAPLPGWYGKLPGMGDFAHRRLPDHFLATWDHWLQHELHGLRTRHPDWVDRYLQGPLWFFSLGEGVVGQRPWVGIMMPSVDAAGRYFPLTLAAELRDATTPLQGAAAASCGRYWALSSAAAVEGLDQDMDAGRFDVALQERFKDAGLSPQDNSLGAVRLPDSHHSSWFQSPQQTQEGDVLTAGLPQGASFDALFGFAQGCTSAVCEVVQ